MDNPWEELIDAIRSCNASMARYKTCNGNLTAWRVEREKLRSELNRGLAALNELDLMDLKGPA